MEQFCADQFWNWNLTWGNDRAYPEFTECFRNTALQCLGSVWLWLSVPVYVYVLLRHYRSEPLPRSWLSTARQSLLVLQLSVRLLQLRSVTDDVIKHGGSYWNARVVGPAAEGLTMLSVMTLMELERRKRFVTSGVLSLFWLLTSLSATGLLYSSIVKEGYVGTSTEASLLKTWLGFAVCQLVLCFFAEELPQDKDTRDCPLTRSTFFSRLTYSWMGNFVKIVKERPIAAGDFTKLMPSEQSEIAIAQFEAVWDKEVDIQRSRTTAKSDPSKPPRISVLKVLLKTYGLDLVGTNGLKLVGTVMDLCLPYLLGCLISLAEDSSIPAWKGLVYLAGFVLCLGLYFFTTNYVWHLSVCIAQRLRACLTSAIYKKSLRMTNRARSESTVGEMVNLMSTDLKSMKDCMAYVWVFWCYPAYILCCLVLLYRCVGVGAFAGVGVLLVVMPFNAYLAKIGHRIHTDRMDKKDDRIKLLTEILNGIKILKLYAWELAFGERINAMRQEELAILQKQRLVGMIGSFSWCIAPFLVNMVTLATYVFVDEPHQLTAETAFSALAIINMLGDCFHELPHIVSDLLQASVALNRLDTFLNKDDIRPDNVTHLPSGNLSNYSESPTLTSLQTMSHTCHPVIL